MLYTFRNRSGFYMKEITLDILKDAANRLLFEMSEEEYQTLLTELATLVKEMGVLGEIESLGYEPMTFPFDCETTYLREDEPSEPLGRDAALSNSGSTQDCQIKLPKVVG